MNHTQYADLRDFERESLTEKVLGYLLATAIGSGLAVLLVVQLSK
jgi:ABC-type nitrate/sulfonate/bicarbonate transport system permease component